MDLKRGEKCVVFIITVIWICYYYYNHRFFRLEERDHWVNPFILKLTKIIFKGEVIFLISKFTVSLRKEELLIIFITAAKSYLPGFVISLVVWATDPEKNQLHSQWMESGLGGLRRALHCVNMCPNGVHDTKKMLLLSNYAAWRSQVGFCGLTV